MKPRIHKNEGGKWVLERPTFGFRQVPDAKEYDTREAALKALSDLNGTASGSYGLWHGYEPGYETRWGFRTANYPMRIT